MSQHLACCSLRSRTMGGSNPSSKPVQPCQLLTTNTFTVARAPATIFLNVSSRILRLSISRCPTARARQKSSLSMTMSTVSVLSNIPITRTAMSSKAFVRLFLVSFFLGDPVDSGDPGGSDHDLDENNFCGEPGELGAADDRRDIGELGVDVPSASEASRARCKSMSNSSSSRPSRKARFRVCSSWNRMAGITSSYVIPSS